MCSFPRNSCLRLWQDSQRTPVDGMPAGQPTRARYGGRSRGFTLLELMIVMSILALLIGVTWPALRKPLMRSTTQEAARQLVRDVARARMAAVESGLTMALRFEPGGSRYTIAPAEAVSPTQEPGEADDPREYPAEGGSENEPPPLLSFSAEFEYDVVFRDPAAVDNDLMLLDSTLGESLRDEFRQTEEVKPLVDSEESRTEFSPPILFYPTGRAENADFVLAGPDGYSLTVTLRGLTGAVKIGPLKHTTAAGVEDGQRFEQARLPDTPQRP